MKKLILLILCIPLLASAQLNWKAKSLWGAAADTIGNITKQDTMYWRGYVDGETFGWQELTNYISAAEKTGETNQLYVLSNESNWTWMEIIEFKIESGGGELSGAYWSVGGIRGAVTAVLKPDTSGTVTKYTLKIGGN